MNDLFTIISTMLNRSFSKSMIPDAITRTEGWMWKLSLQVGTLVYMNWCYLVRLVFMIDIKIRLSQEEEMFNRFPLMTEGSPEQVQKCIIFPSPPPPEVARVPFVSWLTAPQFTPEFVGNGILPQAKRIWSSFYSVKSNLNENQLILKTTLNKKAIQHKRKRRLYV